MEKEALQVLDTIEPRLYWFLAKLVVALILALVAKARIENIVAYIMFRMNKDLGKGVHIRVRGIEGKIAHFNTQWIYVTTDQGQEIISMARWKFEKWTLINSKHSSVS